MEADPTAGSLSILSRNVSRAIEEIIKTTEGGTSCDWVLGLEIGSPWGTLAPRSDGSLLLDLLWADRKYFLKAFAETYPLGLPGVMFLLWRYWRLGRYVLYYGPRVMPFTLHGTSVLDVNYSKNPTILSRSPLYEVLWRCCLVAPTDQQSALVYINACLDETSDLWRKEPVDLEDCRTLLRVYIDRLSPTNLNLYLPLDQVTTAGRCLQFALLFARPGVEDLLPSMFGLTIHYIMDCLQITENISEQPRTGLDSVGMIFFFLT